MREPSYTIILGDGGLSKFCRLFNRRFKEKAFSDRPEWRPFVGEAFDHFPGH